MTKAQPGKHVIFMWQTCRENKTSDSRGYNVMRRDDENTIIIQCLADVVCLLGKVLLLFHPNLTLSCLFHYLDQTILLYYIKLFSSSLVF